MVLGLARSAAREFDESGRILGEKFFYNRVLVGNSNDTGITLPADAHFYIENDSNTQFTLSLRNENTTAPTFKIDSVGSDGAHNIVIWKVNGANALVMDSDKKVTIYGDLQVDGTTTTVNSTTLDVADANITVNDGGNQASANGIAGLTVEMSDATDAKILYDSSLASKFKVGEQGSESEIITAAGSQTISGAKTFTSAVSVVYAGSPYYEVSDGTYTSRLMQDGGTVYLDALHANGAIQLRTGGGTQALNIASDQKVYIPGQLGIGVVAGGPKVEIRGTGTGVGDVALRIQNSSGQTIADFRGDQTIYFASRIGIGTAPQAAYGIVTGLSVSFGRIHSSDTYTSTTGNAANVHIGSDRLLYRSTSSRRYKKDIKDYDKGLDHIMTLKPSYFKDINKDTLHVGFIAEDFDNQGLGEFVEYDVENRPDAIQYGQISALLAKGIQELKEEKDAENEALRAEILELKTMLQQQ